MKFKDLQFQYLFDTYVASRRPTGNFKTFLHLNNRYPLVSDEKSTWVYGHGHIRPKKKTILEAPVIQPETDWNEYLDNYGKYTLFYAITGEQLGYSDCCYHGANHEFNSALIVGIEKHQSFMSTYSEFNKIQKECLNEYHWKNWELIDINKNLIVPSFSITLFSAPPYMDVVNDDDKLMNLFVEIEYKKNRNIDDIEKDILSGIFPVCIKDRITYLFGEEATRLYQSLI